MASPKIEKPELIKLNLMRGSTTKEKQVIAKLKGGIIEYSGMGKDETIVYFGQGGYSLYDIQTKKMELFYDITRKNLIKLSDLGGSPQSDAIADLTKNFVIASKKAEDNMGMNDNVNNLGKWTLGIIMIVALLAMVFMYLMATHVPIGGATASPTTIVQTPLIHINAT